MNLFEEIGSIFTNPSQLWDKIWTGGANGTNAEINDKNIALQRETNALNEKLLREQWAREDTAYSRTVKDMQSVGLSPLAMSGLNPTGSAMGMNAPQATQGAVPNDAMKNIISTHMQKKQMKQAWETNMAQLQFQEEKARADQEQAKSNLEETKRHNKAMEQRGAWEDRIINMAIDKFMPNGFNFEKNSVKSAIEKTISTLANEGETEKNIGKTARGYAEKNKNAENKIIYADPIRYATDKKYRNEIKEKRRVANKQSEYYKRYAK